MTTPEIRALCIDASQKYYDYLEKNNKGLSTIAIKTIKRISDKKLKFIISNKIFDTDAIVLKSLSNNAEYLPERMGIEVYDRDTNTLILKPSRDLFLALEKANASDWFVISDLKFLVERVRQWYLTNGANIKLPQKKAEISPPDNSIFFEDEKPSSEQIEAIKSIFENPLTYIWGAPGTGKTQFVLSYAILHYLSKGKKVAIVAPTNHALEQIFRGVIKMSDKAEIDRKNILRLGTPTKKFADEYPDVCELVGLEKQLKTITDQIKIIEKLIGLDKYSEERGLLTDILNIIPNIQSKLEEIKRLDLDCVPLDEKFDRIDTKVSHLAGKAQAIGKELKKLRKRRNSFFYKLAKNLGRKANYGLRIQKLEWQEFEMEKEIRNLNYDRESSKIATQENRNKKREIERALGILSVSLKSNFKDVKLEVESIDSETDLKQVTDKVNGRLKAINDQINTTSFLNEEYAEDTPETLSQKLVQLKVEKEHLENYSTAQRMKNVSIIGATLDTYLYRFKTEKLEVDHIFLDEAGYSNIVKAQTLFNQEVPVTFLGDHKQLPPVCEISKQSIQKDEKYRPVMVWDQSAIFLEDLYQLNDLGSIVTRYLNSTEASFDVLKKKNLTATYRFGSKLATVLEEYVYPNGFNSKIEEETEIIIYNVRNTSNLRNGTRENTTEVLAIQYLLKNSFTHESDVVVLAPYNDQVKALKKQLPKYDKNNRLLTVHKSQGQEWDTVIYSVCDSGNGRRPWFTDSNMAISSGLNNINTAISRAKRQLILVCDKNEWQSRHGQLIQGLLEAATQKIDFENVL